MWEEGAGGGGPPYQWGWDPRRRAAGEEFSLARFFKESEENGDSALTAGVGAVSLHGLGQVSGGKN